MRFLTKAHQEDHINTSFVSKLIFASRLTSKDFENVKNTKFCVCCKITRYSGQAQSELTMKLFSCLSSDALLVVILRENNSFYLSLEAVNIA